MKKAKTLLYGTATAALLLSAQTTTTHADEVKTDDAKPTDKQVTTNPVVTSEKQATEEMATVQPETEEEYNANVEAGQHDVDAAKKVVDKDQVALDEANEVKDEAQKEVDTIQTEVKDLEQTVTDGKTAVEEATKEKEDAKAQLDKLPKQEATEAEVTKAQSEVTKNKQEVTDATKDVTTKQAAAKEAEQTKLEADAKLEAAENNAEKLAKQSTSEVVSDAKETLDTKNQELTQAKQDETKVKAEHQALTDSREAVAKEKEAAQTEVDELKKAPVKKTVVKTNTWNEDNFPDTKFVGDTITIELESNPSYSKETADINNIAKEFEKHVNIMRKANGLDEMHLSDEMMEVADIRAKEQAPGMSHDAGTGLKSEMENLAEFGWDGIESDEEAAVKLMLMWFDETLNVMPKGDPLHYGHRATLLQYIDGFGIGFDKDAGVFSLTAMWKRSSTNNMDDVFELQDKRKYIKNNAEHMVAGPRYEFVYTKTEAANEDDLNNAKAKLAELTKQLEAIDANIATAATKLEAAHKTVADKEAQVKTAQDAYNKVLANDKLSHAEAIAKAQAEVTKAQTAVDEAVKSVTETKEAVTKAQEVLTKAQDKLLNAEETLANLNNVKDARTKLAKQITEAETKVKAATAAVTEATAKLEETKGKLPLANDKLTKAETEVAKVSAILSVDKLALTDVTNLLNRIKANLYKNAPSEPVIDDTTDNTEEEIKDDTKEEIKEETKEENKEDVKDNFETESKEDNKEKTEVKENTTVNQEVGNTIVEEKTTVALRSDVKGKQVKSNVKSPVASVNVANQQVPMIPQTGEKENHLTSLVGLLFIGLGALGFKVKKVKE